MEINVKIDSGELLEMLNKIRFIIHLQTEGQEFLSGYELGQLQGLLCAFYAKVRTEERKLETENGRLL